MDLPKNPEEIEGIQLLFRKNIDSITSQIFQIFINRPKPVVDFDSDPTVFVEQLYANFNSSDLFAGSKIALMNQDVYTQHDFIALLRQRWYTFDYFTHFLKRAYDFAAKNGYSKLAAMLGYNYMDETGEKPDPDFDTTHFLTLYPAQEDDRKNLPHQVLRYHAKTGYEDAYNKRLQDTDQSENIPQSWETFDKINAGTMLFNKITQTLMKDRTPNGDLRILGAVLFLEKIVPLEMENIIQARKRLFPNLPEKTTFYEEYHHQHDADMHFPALIAGLQEAKLTSEDIRQINIGGRIMQQAKELLYFGHSMEQEAEKIGKFVGF